MLANFNCFDKDEFCGVGARRFDYNVKLTGPSPRIGAQRDVCRDRGLRTNVNAIRESGRSGYMGQWRVQGMNGCTPEELQYHRAWKPDCTAEEPLSTMVGRDFRLDRAALNAVIDAWRLLSASWDGAFNSLSISPLRLHHPSGERRVLYCRDITLEEARGGKAGRMTREISSLRENPSGRGK